MISFFSDLLTIKKCNKGGYTENTIPDKLKDLINFYKTHYANTISNNETIYYDKLSYVVWVHVRSNIVFPITQEHIIGLRNVLIENINI